MKIGVIGSGNIGAALAELFAKAGHQVEISNSRDPEFLRNFAYQSILKMCPQRRGDAVEFAEVVLLAIPLFFVLACWRHTSIHPLAGIMTAA